MGLYEKMGNMNTEALKKKYGLNSVMSYPSGGDYDGVTCVAEITLDGDASSSRNTLIGRLPMVAGALITEAIRKVKCRSLRVTSVQQMINEAVPGKRVTGTVHIMFDEK